MLISRMPGRKTRYKGLDRPLLSELLDIARVNLEFGNARVDPQ